MLSSVVFYGAKIIHNMENAIENQKKKELLYILMVLTYILG
jgi:hypothetical protein